MGWCKVSCSLYPITVLLLLFVLTHLPSVSQAARLRLDYSVLEEQPKGVHVGDILHDANFTQRYPQTFPSVDSPTYSQNSPVFQIRGGGAYQPERRLFKVDRQLGTVTTADVVDREELCPRDSGGGVEPVDLQDEIPVDRCELSFDVNVRFQHQGNWLSETVRVVVEILDVNDNPPVFNDHQVTVNIVESSPAGSLFLLPAATDADSRQYGVREYQLRQAERGELSDSQPTELPFDLEVKGGAGGGVSDVRLRLTSRLDRELKSSYDMTLTAIDGGQPLAKSTQLVVHVNVLDSNDNSPRFEQTEYRAEVPEDLAPGTSLIRVHATDMDQGPNGLVAYSFPDHVERSYGAVFRVDEDTGVILLRSPLDYERTPVYHLSVAATDRGTPPSLPVFTKVTISVVDINDVRPSIAVNVLTTSGSAEVRENSDPAGTFVAHIAARDGDAGDNGKVECQLDDGGTQLFRLEPLFDVSVPSSSVEYKIVTTATLDREQRSEYQLVITCRDGGSPAPLESSREITVIVLDENDNSPRLTAVKDGIDYVVNVLENSPAGTELYRINATDADTDRNAALVYEIRPIGGATGSDDVLAIDRKSGRISSKISFDYETLPRDYAFLVTVKDSGATVRSATATLRLNVVDVNDEMPRFDRLAYYFTVVEDQPAGTSIGRLSATDLDGSRQFNRVVYDVRRTAGSGNGNDGDAFEVDRKTGEVRTVRRLDREQRAVYVFSVVASNDDVITATGGDDVINDDSTAADVADVTVYVDDVNDNRPVFVFPGQRRGRSVDLSDSVARTVGGLVCRLEATDADISVNADIEYNIASGNDDNAFDIDQQTGVITVGSGLANRLDMSTNRLHRLVVVARDLGSPSLQTVADLTVFVNDSLRPVGAESKELSIFGVDSSDGRGSATVIVAAGAAIGGALAIACLILVSILVCIVRRRKKRRREQELEKERRAREELVRAPSSLGGASSCCQHHCSRSPTSGLAAAARSGGFIREPGPGDDGSFSTCHCDLRPASVQSSSEASSVSSSHRRRQAPPTCSGHVIHHGGSCRCCLSVDEDDDVHPTLTGDVVDSAAARRLQDGDSAAGGRVPDAGGIVGLMGHRSTTDSGFAIDSPEQDCSMSPGVSPDGRGVNTPTSPLVDQVGSLSCGGGWRDPVGREPAAADCRQSAPQHRRHQQSTSFSSKHRQQQHCRCCCSTGQLHQRHSHHRNHQYSAVHRCNSWLPTVITGQDPLEQSPGGVTTAGCDTDSVCSCCTGSRADSGRGHSEEDDLLAANQQRRCCAHRHLLQPLLMTSPTADCPVTIRSELVCSDQTTRT